MPKKKTSGERFYLEFGNKMSRIGKKEIKLPEKTSAKIDGNTLTVTGPLGSLSREFKGDISIKVSDGMVTAAPEKSASDEAALWGTTTSHIVNMVSGVNKPYEKKLLIEGIGFKAEVKADKIVMNLGFSHQVTVLIPKDLKVVIEKNIITVSGIDKEKVGQFVANVRALKKPEPYKGKGIMYVGEVIRRKQGKKAA